MLVVWSLMHGAAMLIIRGRFEGALRAQTVHACVDALDAVLKVGGRPKGIAHSGPRWPSTLILGEGKKSSVGNGGARSQKRKSRPRKPHR
jgi:hypothetical protein